MNAELGIFHKLSHTRLTYTKRDLVDMDDPTWFNPATYPPASYVVIYSQLSGYPGTHIAM